MRNTFLRNVRRFPWVTNVTMYGCLFAGGDFVHQWFSLKEEMDWRHTRNVAVVAFSFHGNFNFFWMRFLERVCPGNSAGMVLRKLFLDQTTAAPLATSVFYTGVSFLEGKDDILEDWREKFLNTYKTGLMFWPFMQFLNFALVPLYLRTTFTGCCAFVWATFLCFSRQSGDGTAAAALAWMFTPKQEAPEPKEERDLVPKVEATGAADQKPPPALVQEVHRSVFVKPGTGEQATEQEEESPSNDHGTTLLAQKTTNPTNDIQTTNPKDTQAADLEASRIKGA